jgi:putative transposase
MSEPNGSVTSRPALTTTLAFKEQSIMAEPSLQARPENRKCVRVITAKIYPNEAQVKTLESWLRTCCWVYNRALEQRIKAHKRRNETAGFYSQCTLLTGWRERVPQLESVPLAFQRDALRRVDRGMQAFFRRVKAGAKPGFPRFRPHHRYNSLECLAIGKYVRSGDFLNVPKLGLIKFRAGNQSFRGTQKLLRIIRRASGWFVQVLIDDGRAIPQPQPIDSSIGVDVGLTTFATLSNGERIENHRWGRKSGRKLRSAQRRLSRTAKRSRNRRKAIARVQRVHEKIAAQRKDFAHRASRRIINRFNLIAVEKLNIKGLARTKLAKSIADAAWGQFIWQLMYKAEWAGRHLVQVDPRGTSQECPDCGATKKKKLSERTHACTCGLVCDRDHAAARVILLRAVGSSRGKSPVEEVTAVARNFRHQVAPVKQEV